MQTGRQVGRWIAGAVTGLALGGSALAAQGTGPMHHGPEVNPTLLVSASAEVRVAPDRAWLGIVVETRGRTSAQAGADNARIQTAVLEALNRLGVSGNQVQTRAVQVSPEYQYPREGGRPTVTGYVARNEVAVELSDLTKIGAVIDASLGAGASNVSGPRYGLAFHDTARRQALEAAVLRAMSDAQTIARAANVRVGRVLELNYDGAGGVVEAPEMVRMRVAAADAPETPVETGLITVRATVQLRVAIVP